jgi:hypothetical protein
VTELSSRQEERTVIPGSLKQRGTSQRATAHRGPSQVTWAGADKSEALTTVGGTAETMWAGLTTPCSPRRSERNRVALHKAATPLAATTQK